MGERVSVNREELDARVINFPTVSYELVELKASHLSDIELEETLNRDLSRNLILKVGSDNAATFVINGTLEACHITRPIVELLGPDRKVIESMRKDAIHTSAIVKQVGQAREWLVQAQQNAVHKYDLVDEIENLKELVGRTWAETNLFRSFEILRARVEANMRDTQQNAAIIEAHRLAIIMMARATPEE